MHTRLQLDILPQPDETTCGPTCLHALYRYYGDDVSLEAVVNEVPALEGGGTLAVLLANHALARNYQGTIYTYNLQVFDPTWFRPDGPDIAERLRAQAALKPAPKLQFATKGYLDFLSRGGEILLEDLTSELIRKYLTRGIPILTGLSATYLYGDPREVGPVPKGRGTPYVADDVGGSPAGHFVVLTGYNREERTVQVADPLMPNPLGDQHHYALDIDRVKNAILLGIVTYDANLLILQPKKVAPARRPRAHRNRGQ